PYEAVNAGQSGETSAGSLARIDWVLREPADVLVIETGANDGLRGLSVTAMRENIQGIIDAARNRPSPPGILLIGMEAPPNLGPRYTGQFRTAFADLARQNGTAFLPFLLTGVAGLDSLNQADGIHPTAEGQEIIAGHVWQALRPMLSLTP
ncbi:MAG: arylesterase, partial [Gemmatimonadales bacterium]